MKKRIIIINGPNLNNIGSREPHIYGDKPFGVYLDLLKKENEDVTIDYFQSNIEGDIINKIQTSEDYNYIIINPGGYTHTSVAIADAIATISIPVVEVHITNIYNRETFRQEMITSRYCKGIIIGFGLESYNLALKFCLSSS